MSSEVFELIEWEAIVREIEMYPGVYQMWSETKNRVMGHSTDDEELGFIGLGKVMVMQG